MAKLETIEGIGAVNAKKLRDAGISTTEALLEKGATSRGRRELSAKTGIGAEYIMDWVNRADLMRVSGIGEEYSDLLEKAGVDSVVELAQRNTHPLHAKIIEVNNQKHLVRRPPSMTMVARWIMQARTMPRAVSY